MANPNRTVWAAKHQKWFVTETKCFSKYPDAKAFADALRKEGKRVRLTSFRVGPKTERFREYAVRVYEKV